MLHDFLLLVFSFFVQLIEEEANYFTDLIKITFDICNKIQI